MANWVMKNIIASLKTKTPTTKLDIFNLCKRKGIGLSVSVCLDCYNEICGVRSRCSKCDGETILISRKFDKDEGIPQGFL